MRIDLHTHSSVSDGTDTPAQLMEQAAGAGLDVVALTDHDTTAGWAEAAGRVADTGVALVRGTEISCSWHGISVHLLSYLHREDHTALAAELEASRTSRDSRARTMVELLAADYELAWEDVLAQATPGATIGRPHIADALVAKGYLAERGAAFASVLSAAGPYYVRYHAPDALEAVRLIRDAGGVPVFAHPAASARGRIVSEDAIRRLADAGLAGLEVHHRDHAPEAVTTLTALAAELDLFVTGSSDYHGQGKPNRLGEHTTSPAVLARIEEEGALEVLRP